MENNTLLTLGAVLLVGIAVGYGVGVNKNQTIYSSQPMMGMHAMPDGSMMANNGQEMDMDEMMMSMNAQLQGKTGDEFDKSFISEMIVHHQGAVSMAELALGNAKHQEIKDLAKAIISAQNKEIADMKAWQASWYGN